MVDRIIRVGIRFAVVFVALAMFFGAPSTDAGERAKVWIKSSIDGTSQPSYVILPEGFDPQGPPVPLLVALHSWSRDLEYRGWTMERLAEERGWIYLFPNFRGPNQHPDACGSLKAQQDILDAVAWAKATYRVDGIRVYLVGASGGGHMTMLMVGRHPEVWAAASAWVGISDLAAWHKLHARGRYGQMMRLSCGGAPGDSPQVDRQYRERSPITHIHRAVNVALDLNTGIKDGHEGSVPIRHTLDAFNAIARAAGCEPISEEEIQQLSRPDGRLKHPRETDQVTDSSYGRQIHLRRHAGGVRVTVFEGGHEILPHAAVAWLEKKVRSTTEEGPKAGDPAVGGAEAGSEGRGTQDLRR
jgi:poly(3-hydroxybutyrate) depolymerase